MRDGFALRNTPEEWDEVAPAEFGARNYLEAGSGLGGDKNDDLWMKCLI